MRKYREILDRDFIIEEIQKAEKAKKERISLLPIVDIIETEDTRFAQYYALDYIWGFDNQDKY